MLIEILFILALISWFILGLYIGRLIQLKKDIKLWDKTIDNVEKKMENKNYETKNN